MRTNTERPQTTPIETRALKVVTFVTQMEGGGAQAAAVKLGAGLRARGFDAETWFGYQKRATYQGVPFVRCLLPRKPIGPLAPIKFLAEIRRELENHAPDVLITFTHYSNVLGQIAGAWRGVPVRIASQRQQLGAMPRLAVLADAVLGSTGLYDANVMVSEAVRRGFRFHPMPYRRRTSVIVNGIDPHQSRMQFEAASVRLELDIPEGSFVIASVARLAAVKNQRVLIRMLARARRQDIHLVLVGDGPERSALMELSADLEVASRVHFLGDVPQTSVQRVLREADAFALPSFNEGMSNALLEALAAGLPILASDIPPQREVLVDNGKPHGILIRPHDVSRWATCTDLLSTSALERERWAALARARAGNFTTDRMVDQFAALIDKLSIGKVRRQS